MIERVVVKSMKHHQTSAKLERRMKKSNYNKISAIEVELHDEHDGIAEEAMKFIAKEQIEDFEKYCGFGEILNKDGAKVFEGDF